MVPVPASPSRCQRSRRFSVKDRITPKATSDSHGNAAATGPGNAFTATLNASSTGRSASLIGPCCALKSFFQRMKVATPDTKKGV